LRATALPSPEAAPVTTTLRSDRLSTGISCPRSKSERSSDNSFHDFAGSTVDTGYASILIQSRDGKLSEIPIASEQLQTPINQCALSVAGWYRDGLDAREQMPLLSAFLGHAGPEETHWYLEAARSCSGRPQPGSSKAPGSRDAVMTAVAPVLEAFFTDRLMTQLVTAGPC
jgi:hypothetical protein